jgi:hypothetical protein
MSARHPALRPTTSTPAATSTGTDLSGRAVGAQTGPHNKVPAGSDPGLRRAAIFFALAALLHNGDHFRRGLDSVTAELQVAGWAGMALSAVAIAVVLRGHRTAPLVAVSAGFPLALGFASDPFVSGGASVLSIVASILEILGAAWLGVAGLAALRRSGGLAASA